MRIGFDISKLMPPRDGIGTYTEELLRALGAAAGDHRLLCYDLLHPVSDDAWRRAIDGVPEAVARLRRQGEMPPADPDVDLFHATAWQCPAGYRGPLVFTCYDLTVLTHGAAHTVANRVRCLTGLLRARLRDATFVTLSQDTAAALGRWLEVPAARLRVIAPAVSARFRPPADDAAAAALGRLGIGGGYVLAVGTLEPRKNLPRLVDAWSALPAALRDGRELVIAGGRGWRLGDLEARLARREAGGRLDGVRLLGHVDDGDLPALYAGADAFVYPSLAEGFGFPVLEAMACGAPVITSATSSLPEVAGDAALLIDPLDTGALRDALAALLGDRQRAARLRDAGRARAQAFSWAESARRTLELYRAVHHEAG